MTDSKPVLVNDTIKTVKEAIHIALMDVAVNASISAAIASQPWLGLPVIKQFFSLIVKIGAGYFEGFIDTAAAFAIIDEQTEKEASDYRSSVDKLVIAQQSGDPNAVTKATEDLKEALARLIHSDGIGRLR